MKRKRLFSLSKQITNKRNNISADDDRHFVCAVISCVIINKRTDEYVHARLCARAPSAAFKMAEQGNDTEHEEFVEDTALLCPHGKKKKHLSALQSIVQLY